MGFDPEMVVELGRMADPGKGFCPMERRADFYVEALADGGRGH